MYKTIVVHIDGGPLQASRLRVAAMLAQQHEAHLIGSAATGVSWMDYAMLTGTMSGPVPDLGADYQGLRDAAAVRLEAFRQATERLGVASFEGRIVEDDARYALLLQSRYADLIVLSQDDAQRYDPDLPSVVRGLPEYVALRGARPVLVVPPGYTMPAGPGTAVVGWDGSMQAIRAIAAALPLLRRCEGVKLALINPDELSQLHGEQPGADMALYLARHGLNVEIVLERTGTTHGGALLALARDSGAGLLVTGAYGHSRFREWVLGGVTRELLERATVPLLLAH